MAVSTQSFTVTTTRVQIASTADDRQIGPDVWLYGEFHGSSNKIAIGGSDVTLATGIHIYGGDKLGPIRLRNADAIYAISDAAGGVALHVMVVGD